MPPREPGTFVRLPAGVRSTLRRLANQGGTSITETVTDAIELLAATVDRKEPNSLAQQIAAIRYFYDEDGNNG